MAQYPMDMGQKKKKKSNTLVIQVDAEKKINKYGKIAWQGQSKGRVIYRKKTDLVPKKL